VLAVFSSVIFADAFADSLIVHFDKELYDLGDFMTVSGEIMEVGMPVIAMSVYDPDGKILSANNLEISSEKTFSKTVLLESPFYEKSGRYLVKFDYGPISENHYFLVEGKYSEPEISIEETADPEIILLYTEQKQYTDNDVVRITGQVSAVVSPTVLIGIYDPFGMPAGFYFGPIDSNLEFTTSFLVKDGVNFRIDGTYSVKAHYGETVATSFFDYYKIPQTVIKDPVAKDPVAKDPVAKDPVAKDPVAKDPVAKDPVAKDPVAKDPVAKDPVAKDPVAKDPVAKDPVAKDPVAKDPVTDKVSVEIEKPNNLTVEDIELGKLLNQIKLKCDSSTYADTISYYDGMGPALYRLCQFDSSLSFFNESLIKNPNNVEFLVNKGSALGKLGYFSEAMVYYDHAIEIDPNFLPAKNNKANALANLGRFSEAILLYGEVLERNPNYLTARANLEIALSSNIDASAGYSELDSENIPDQISTESEKTLLGNSEKQKPGNFFDEIGNLFSTLSSLFGLQN